MEGSLSEELYSESLQLSKLELGHTSTTNCDDTGAVQDEDPWGDSDGEFDKASDLDREWQKRRDLFHNIGYRDGITVGKEASAQEGFNYGFKQSFIAGYNWGIVRGVTSALACLPDEPKEILVETQESRNKFQALHESAHSISTTDALKMFHDSLLAKKEVESSDHAEASSNIARSQEQGSDQNCLEKRYGELESLLVENPAIQVDLGVQKL